jgi:hypothetical protein
VVAILDQGGLATAGGSRWKSVKPMPDVFLVGGKPLKRGAVLVKVFGNLTPNDTKLGRR